MIDREQLMSLFEAELPGIAAKGVEALRRLDARGHFDPQGEATKGKEEFAMAIDQVRRWLVDGDATAGPNIETELKRLHAAYGIWADRTAPRSKLGEAEFSHRLDAFGYPVIKVAGATYHKGISVPLQVAAQHTPATFF
jgi:phage/plasmid-associated DNA primase